MKRIFFGGLLLLIGTVMFYRCSNDSRSSGGVNIFAIDDDKKLGLQMSQQIEADPVQYPLLNTTTYATAYSYLYKMRDTILATHKVAYDTVFPWSLNIIYNDTVVNAFCTPGGYIYIYTGIIKSLDNEAELAGVMAHEMAHAANRHSTDQLTKVYGVQLLLGLLTGDNPGTVAQIVSGLAQGLASLAFSRQDEYQADEYAVKYLYSTSYDAMSLADFFTKIEGLPRPPTFLSTHPSPTDRKTKISEIFNSLGGVHGQTYESRYLLLKAALP